MGALARVVPGWLALLPLEEFAKPRGPALRARFCGIFTPSNPLPNCSNPSRYILSTPLQNSPVFSPPPGPSNPLPVYTRHSPPKLSGIFTPSRPLQPPPGIYPVLRAGLYGIFTPSHPSWHIPGTECKTSRYFYSPSKLPGPFQALPDPSNPLSAPPALQSSPGSPTSSPSRHLPTPSCKTLRYFHSLQPSSTPGASKPAIIPGAYRSLRAGISGIFYSLLPSRHSSNVQSFPVCAEHYVWKLWYFYSFRAIAIFNSLWYVRGFSGGLPGVSWCCLVRS